MNDADVGNGKEAADAKLRESLKLFAQNPQITSIYFGGCHDNVSVCDGPFSLSALMMGHRDILLC